jgi:translation initiation factor 3 subunit B
LLQENLLKWLTDDKARDQFVIRAGTYTEVYWNDARKLAPELVFQKQVLLFLTFSSWGGESGFERLMRFAHPQVLV